MERCVYSWGKEPDSKVKSKTYGSYERVTGTTRFAALSQRIAAWFVIALAFEFETTLAGRGSRKKDMRQAIRGAV
jgi:hypothetical protein